MPLEQCTENGKSGWRYGGSGKCYAGSGGKKKAIKQGLAESYRSGEKFKGWILAIQSVLADKEGDEKNG